MTPPQYPKQVPAWVPCTCGTLRTSTSVCWANCERTEWKRHSERKAQANG